MTASSHSRQPAIPAVARVLLLAATSLLILIAQADPAFAFDPWWVQTHVDTQLWSGQDEKAVSFGAVLRGSNFLVMAPQQGSRLYVKNAFTGAMAYIDASAVGPAAPPRIPPASVAPPSGPAGVKRTPPTSPAGFTPFWIANWKETELWSGPEPWAYSLGPAPQFRRYLVIEPQQGNRLKVWNPENEVVGFVDTAVIGPVGPSVWLQPQPLRITRQVGLPGRSVGDSSYVRNLPVAADETELRQVTNNTPLDVLEAGVAADGTEWYTLGPGQYIRASEVRLPMPPAETREGRWIDVDLAQPALVTAYDGDRIERTALTIIGTTATPTLKGQYKIVRRVENEIMDSATLGIPRDGEGGYYLKDVLYTQYFTPYGAAIHYNYWLGTFGRPGSHGCLGLNLEDAVWFWDWASVGTPVIVR